MTTYVPPKKNDANGWIGYVSLAPRTATGAWQSNPTLASGDVKVSLDGGSLANLTTLPAVTPASSKLVKITLSQAEVNADNVAIIFSDAAGAEWSDVTINLQTTARRIDDLAYPATSGRSMVVDASGLVDANAVKVGPTGSGTAQTARDIGASVLLSTGTGTGQLDFTSGVVKANLAQILGTALTETAGLLAGGFKKFFNIATPASTMDALTLVATATNLTNAPTAGDLTAAMKTSVTTAATAATPTVTLAAAAVTAIWDKATSALTTVGSIGKLLVDNVNATISSRSSHTAADIWAVATRTLTSLSGVAADIRSAVGLASANLDTQFAGINTTLGTISTFRGIARGGDVTVVLGPNDRSRSIGAKLSTTGQTSIYTCPAATYAKGVSIQLCNVDGSNAADVTIEWLDFSASTTYKLLSTYSLPADYSEPFSLKGLSMEPGDQIYVTTPMAGNDVEVTLTVTETQGRN